MSDCILIITSPDNTKYEISFDTLKENYDSLPNIKSVGEGLHNSRLVMLALATTMQKDEILSKSVVDASKSEYYTRNRSATPVDNSALLLTASPLSSVIWDLDFDSNNKTRINEWAVRKNAYVQWVRYPVTYNGKSHSFLEVKHGNNTIIYCTENSQRSLENYVKTKMNEERLSTLKFNSETFAANPHWLLIESKFKQKMNSTGIDLNLNHLIKMYNHYNNGTLDDYLKSLYGEKWETKAQHAKKHLHSWINDLIFGNSGLIFETEVAKLFKDRLKETSGKYRLDLTDLQNLVQYAGTNVKNQWNKLAQENDFEDLNDLKVFLLSGIKKSEYTDNKLYKEDIKEIEKDKRKINLLDWDRSKIDLILELINSINPDLHYQLDSVGERHLILKQRIKTTLWWSNINPNTTPVLELENIAKKVDSYHHYNIFEITKDDRQLYYISSKNEVVTIYSHTPYNSIESARKQIDKIIKLQTVSGVQENLQLFVDTPLKAFYTSESYFDGDSFTRLGLRTKHDIDFYRYNMSSYYNQQILPNQNWESVIKTITDKTIWSEEEINLFKSELNTLDKLNLFAIFAETEIKNNRWPRRSIDNYGVIQEDNTVVFEDKYEFIPLGELTIEQLREVLNNFNQELVEINYVVLRSQKTKEKQLCWVIDKNLLKEPQLPKENPMAWEAHRWNMWDQIRQVMTKINPIFDNILLLETNEDFIKNLEGRVKNIDSIKAYVENGIIHINVEKANMSDALHEATHMMLGYLRVSNFDRYVELLESVVSDEEYFTEWAKRNGYDNLARLDQLEEFFIYNFTRNSNFAIKELNDLERSTKSDVDLSILIDGVTGASRNGLHGLLGAFTKWNFEKATKYNTSDEISFKEQMDQRKAANRLGNKIVNEQIIEEC